MKNTKWYSLPRAYSWGYLGLIGLVLYTGYIVILCLIILISEYGTDFLVHIDSLTWMLISALAVLFALFANVGIIEMDWDNMSYYDSLDISKGNPDDKMYTNSLVKYILAKGSLYLSWIALAIFAIDQYSQIQKTISEHPTRIIMVLLFVVGLMAYNNRK